MDRELSPVAAEKNFSRLNPADHFLWVMDREIRKSGLAGGYCGFSLDLKGSPDTDRLREGVEVLGLRFPLLTARLVRRGRRYGWQACERELPLLHHGPPAGADESAYRKQTLAGLMNSSESPDEDSPLSFHLVQGAGGSSFLVRWLHPLLDAGGVKLLLDFLVTADREVFRDDPLSLVGQRLHRWTLWQQIRAGHRAKKHNDAIDRLTSTLPGEQAAGPRHLAQALQRFDPAQTQTINQQAVREMGLAGRTLYFIACLMRAMEKTGPAVPGTGCCVPYAFNLRPQNARGPVLGNQVSVLFAQAPCSILADRKVLFRYLKDQYVNTVRQQLDYAYLPLMWLGQWLSPESYGRILRYQRNGGERSTFRLSDIGEVRFADSGFLGTEIVGMQHFCLMTSPPSLAVLLGQLNGRLSLSWNYLVPDLPAAWVERMQAALEVELLGPEVA